MRYIQDPISYIKFMSSFKRFDATISHFNLFLIQNKDLQIPNSFFRLLSCLNATIKLSFRNNYCRSDVDCKINISIYNIWATWIEWRAKYRHLAHVLTGCFLCAIFRGIFAVSLNTFFLR